MTILIESTIGRQVLQTKSEQLKHKKHNAVKALHAVLLPHGTVARQSLHMQGWRPWAFLQTEEHKDATAGLVVVYSLTVDMPNTKTY